MSKYNDVIEHSITLKNLVNDLHEQREEVRAKLAEADGFNESGELRKQLDHLDDLIHSKSSEKIAVDFWLLNNRTAATRMGSIAKGVTLSALGGAKLGAGIAMVVGLVKVGTALATR